MRSPKKVGSLFSGTRDRRGRLSLGVSTSSTPAAIQGQRVSSPLPTPPPHCSRTIHCGPRGLETPVGQMSTCTCKNGTLPSPVTGTRDVRSLFARRKRRAAATCPVKYALVYGEGREGCGAGGGCSLPPPPPPLQTGYMNQSCLRPSPPPPPRGKGRSESEQLTRRGRCDRGGGGRIVGQ